MTHERANDAAEVRNPSFVTYTRVARGEPDEPADAARQLELCAEFAAAQGWRLVDIFPDGDTSGSQS